MTKQEIIQHIKTLDEPGVYGIKAVKGGVQFKFRYHYSNRTAGVQALKVAHKIFNELGMTKHTVMLEDFWKHRGNCYYLVTVSF